MALSEIWSASHGSTSFLIMACACARPGMQSSSGPSGATGLIGSVVWGPAG
ncbi:hypothetical protein PF008_g30805 [Phytophthora fragariae]|uniref:Uncharacterized protein n=1 Tax=Phytophthora fragariae TaxID=53985 RepID=A0A6G0Q4K8_9STRA|nr:hypothetical protein PF008_g30805 [Phytophthora fragariae]